MSYEAPSCPSFLRVYTSACVNIRERARVRQHLIFSSRNLSLSSSFLKNVVIVVLVPSHPLHSNYTRLLCKRVRAHSFYSPVSRKGARARSRAGMRAVRKRTRNCIPRADAGAAAAARAPTDATGRERALSTSYPGNNGSQKKWKGTDGSIFLYVLMGGGEDGRGGERVGGRG